MHVQLIELASKTVRLQNPTIKHPKDQSYGLVNYTSHNKFFIQCTTLQIKIVEVAANV